MKYLSAKFISNYYLLIPLIFLAGLFFNNQVAQAALYHITTDTSWSPGEVKVIDGSGITIQSGVTLTIATGVILKMAKNTGI